MANDRYAFRSSVAVSWQIAAREQGFFSDLAARHRLCTAGEKWMRWTGGPFNGIINHE